MSSNMKKKCMSKNCPDLPFWMPKGPFTKKGAIHHPLEFKDGNTQEGAGATKQIHSQQESFPQDRPEWFRVKTRGVEAHGGAEEEEKDKVDDPNGPRSPVRVVQSMDP